MKRRIRGRSRSTSASAASRYKQQPTVSFDASLSEGFDSDFSEGVSSCASSPKRRWSRGGLRRPRISRGLSPAVRGATSLEGEDDDDSSIASTGSTSSVSSFGSIGHGVRRSLNECKRVVPKRVKKMAAAAPGPIGGGRGRRSTLRGSVLETITSQKEMDVTLSPRPTRPGDQVPLLHTTREEEEQFSSPVGEPPAPDSETVPTSNRTKNTSSSKELPSIKPPKEAPSRRRESTEQTRRATERTQRASCPEGKHRRRRSSAMSKQEAIDRDCRTEYSMGVVFLVSGEAAKAKEHLQTALTARLLVRGPDHVDVAAVKEKLGDAAVALGEPNEVAQRHYQEALRVMRAHNREDPAAVARLCARLGHVLYDSGEVEEAVGLYEESLPLMELAICTHKNGDEATRTKMRKELFRMKRAIGGACMKRNDYERALKLFKGALRELQVSPGYGAWDKDLAAILYDVGVAHERVGDYDDALKFLEESLEMNAHILKPDHEDVVETRKFKGHVHIKKKEYANAIGCYAEVLRVLRLKENDCDGNHLKAMETVLERLAFCHAQQKDMHKVFDYHNEMLDFMRRRLGTDQHSEVASMLHKIGKLHVKTGQLHWAVKAYEECTEMKRGLFGDDHYEVARTLNNYGAALCKLGAHDDALGKCREALRISRVAPRHHEEETIALNILGLTCTKQENFDEAIGYFGDALEAQKGQQQLGNAAAQKVVTLQNLGDACFRADKHDDAIRVFKQLLATKKAREGTQAVHGELQMLGRTYLEAGKPEDALKYLKRAHNIQRKTQGVDKDSIFATLRSIGDAYALLGSHEKALQSYKSALKRKKDVANPDLEEVITTLWKMGPLYMKLGDNEGALICFRKALKVREKSGNDEGRQPDLSHILHSCADLHLAMDCHSDAMREYTQARSLYSDESPERELKIQHSIAIVKFKSGDLTGARETLDEVLEGRRRLLGSTHPLCGKTLGDMGLVCYEQSNYTEAKDLYELALEVFRNTELKNDHPLVKEVRENMAQVDKTLKGGILSWFPAGRTR